MDMAVESLKEAGVTMVELDVTKVRGFIEGFGKLMLGGSEIPERLLQHEPPIIEDDPSHYIALLPGFIKQIMAFILEKIGMKREAIFLKVIGDSSMDGYSQGVKSKREFENGFNDLMEQNCLDGYISSVTGLPAFKHYDSKELAISVTISAIANLVDYPSTVIPVTKVTKEDLEEVYNDLAYSEDHFVKETRKALEGTEGLPVAIQVCTRSFQDERCLGIAKLVDDIIKNSGSEPSL